MMHYLAVLQFPFLLLSHFLIGLSVYGSDFEKPSGKIYLFTFFIVWFITFLCRYKVVQKTIKYLLNPIQIISILSGLYLYSLLHLNYWDEHSTQQAVLVLLLTLGSLLTALSSLEHLKSQSKLLAFSMFALALVFLINVYFPLVGFLVVSLLILNHVLTPKIKSDFLLLSETKVSIYSLVVLFLLFSEAFMPVWDYQEILVWPWLLFVFFVAMGISLLLRRYYQHRLNENFLYIISVVFTEISVMSPSWVLAWSHALIFGLISGAFIAVLEKKVAIKKLLLSIGTVWFWAGFISFALYQNITIMDYRAVLLLVLVVPMYQYYKLKRY